MIATDVPVSPSVRRVITTTAGHYGVTVARLVGPSRAPSLILPRHVAMFVARSHTGESYPRLGLAFRRDHTSVLAGCRHVERMVAAAEPRLVVDLAAIRVGLAAPPVPSLETVTPPSPHQRTPATIDEIRRLLARQAEWTERQARAWERIAEALEDLSRGQSAR